MNVKTEMGWTGIRPDLKPRADSEVEWWFIHGQVELPDGSDFRFMVSFFQINAQRGGPDVGHMLLVHGLPSDPAAPPYVLSRMTPSIRHLHEVIALRVAEASLPGPVARFLVPRHGQRMLARALLDGIEVRDDPAEVAQAHLSIRWHDFALQEAPDGTLTLTIPSDAAGAPLHLRLTAARPWLDGRGSRLDPRNQPDYAYVSCPRLLAEGQMGDAPVRGTVWMDRQWGQFDNWFLLREPGAVRLVGWHWAGLSLDSGHDFLAARMMVIGGAPKEDGFVISFDESTVGPTRGRLLTLPDGHWTSPQSGITYPLAHRLQLPDLDGEIEITPLRMDQEIPVFGAPAIWEGAVSARGTLLGQPVRGHGRLELYGYGYDTSAFSFLKSQITRRFRRPVR